MLRSCLVCECVETKINKTESIERVNAKQQFNIHHECNYICLQVRSSCYDVISVWHLEFISIDVVIALSAFILQLFTIVLEIIGCVCV